MFNLEDFFYFDMCFVWVYFELSSNLLSNWMLEFKADKFLAVFLSAQH